MLLVTPFASREAFIDRLVADLRPPDPEECRRRLLELLAAELASARAFPGVAAALGFLRRRGLRLGLLSNLASPYRETVDDLGLASAFDAVAFSCDRRQAKPEAGIYLDLCRELAAEPGRVLVVGDSLRNDVAAPRRLGMKSLRVSPTGGRGAVPPFALGWLSLQPEIRPLIAVGEAVRLGGRKAHIARLEPVADDAVGRYNLVVAAGLEGPGDGTGAIYVKRYLLPESAYVDEFTRALMAEAGIEAPSAGIWRDGEPVLWSEAAPGVQVERLDITPDLAFDIGRHGAAAFVFANADYRPRNAFLVGEAPAQRLVMVDYEHCLFNLALDVKGVGDPMDPRCLDELGREALAARIRKRVISPRTCRRNFREFFGSSDPGTEVLRAFRRGWVELTLRAQARRGRLEELLRDRIGSEPFLVIGTRAYRRAMTSLDVEDLLARLSLPPERVLEGWMKPPDGA